MLVLLVLAACGASTPSLAVRSIPERPADRDRMLENAGIKIYGALAAGRPETLIVDDMGLRALVTPEAATTFTALRNAPRDAFPDAASLRRLADAAYSGICLQQSGIETPGGRFGFTAPAWVFHRALVVGTRPSGSRVASWVEGTFVFTTDGIVALDLAAVEAPRWEHADIEIGGCDVEAQVEEPRYVVGVTD